MNRSAALVMAALLLSGCGDGEQDLPPPSPARGTLDLDIRDEAEIELSASADTLSAKVRLTKGFGVAPTNTDLTGMGRVERFPEASLTLYTAKLSLDAIPTGPCGSEPVSLALSLYRRGDSARVGGALTPYCGKDVWFGVPARAPLRITGKLPLPK